MKTAQIRESFLSYFEEHGHTRVASSSLVPHNDQTLLFTNAGMVQFKDVFLGLDKRPYTRATTSQRCVRAGGKHNDLENVGYTERHHTFFEMLGNFSFGEYFKREAIELAWNYLTGVIGLPADKLWVTVFEDDDEAAEIWLGEIGVSPERFARIGAHANFWSMGDTGPCGPCSEIFYDHGPEVAGGPPGTPEEDGDRYVEIWNLVFMQFNRDAQGNQTPLPKPSVDTGMGLERLAAVLQGVHSNYDIDMFQNLTQAARDITGAADPRSKSLRVLADHIRSTAFLITDGVQPGNEGRGYVLRRIIRRAIRHGHQVGGVTPFFCELVAPLVKEMGAAYPELERMEKRVVQVLRQEEERFAETLDQGMRILDQEVADMTGATIPGDTVFRLYDTFGFPMDLTADVARERGLQIDVSGFERAMHAQRTQARAASRFKTDTSIPAELNGLEATSFTGYGATADTAMVKAIFRRGEMLTEAGAGEEAVLVLDQTPFYAEAGGQVGDRGAIATAGGTFEVSDTQKLAQGSIGHFGRVVTGKIAVNDEAAAEVAADRRRATMLNHSATHLLHAALKQVLGEHVEQKGSLVEAARLRFDYSHGEVMTAAQMIAINELVNAQIRVNHEVETRVMDLADARAAGAAALFGEKYDDRVRVLRMGDFSLELCGGTHVARTGDIGLFLLTAETGIAAGIRRVEAVTGQGAMDYLHAQFNTLDNVAAALRATRDEAGDKVLQLLERVKRLEKDNRSLQTQLTTGGAADLSAEAKQANGVNILAKRIDGVAGKSLRDAIDRLRDQLGEAVVVLGSVEGGKAKLAAGVSPSVTGRVHAGELIRHITSLANGRGGGRPDFAEGGIPDGDAIEGCLENARKWVGDKLSAEG